MSARRRVKRSSPSPLPPLLLRVIEAARHAGHQADFAGHDGMLEELGHWAVLYVPANGVLAPTDDAAFNIIERGAGRYLHYAAARKALGAAVRAVESSEQRGAIEEAQNWVQSESDNAYYYAGLACGLSLAELAAKR